jgi:hypothetical protein
VTTKEVTGDGTCVFKFNPEAKHQSPMENSGVSTIKKSINVKIICEEDADMPS